MDEVMMPAVELPITYGDLELWRRERDEIKPHLEQLQHRYAVLSNRIKACEFLIAAKDSETPSAPAQPLADRDVE